jgi:hypothetical protein
MAERLDRPGTSDRREIERIQAEERKKHIAKSAEIMEAFAMGIDRQQPAPDPIRDGSRNE